MKLFYAPGSCSLGIHIILEEMNIDFELIPVDLKSGNQLSAEYKQINPKSKVPALVRDDGTVLTEFPVIAYWLSQNYPEHGLIGTDFETQIRTLELIEFIVSTLHMRGFALWNRPERFTSIEEAQKDVRENGLKVIQNCFEFISEKLGQQSYLMGEFSIADAALFYVMRWSSRAEIGMPDNINKLYQRIFERPAVQRVLEREKLIA